MKLFGLVHCSILGNLICLMLQTFPEHLLCLRQLGAGLNTGNTISEQLEGLDVNRSRIYILWQTWPWFIPCKVALWFGSLSNLRGVTFLFEIIFSLLKMALPQTLLSLIFILGAISLMNLCWHWKTRQLACPPLVEVFR